MSDIPPLFDSHVNLHGEIYDEDRNDVVERARMAGVSRFISICDRLDNFERIRNFSSKTPNMWCSAGVHPHYAKDYTGLKAEMLIKLSEDHLVCGIGETGLDLHYGYSSLEDQLRCFREHIAAARETGLPLIVHTREADQETGDMLVEETRKGAFPILMHCYTSGLELAKRAAELDAYFSVSGIMTFKKAEDVRSLASWMPLDRVILETDCPYLAPTPHRGRRNEPAYLVEICRAFAELKGLSFEEVAQITTQTACVYSGEPHDP